MSHLIIVFEATILTMSKSFLAFFSDISDSDRNKIFLFSYYYFNLQYTTTKIEFRIVNKFEIENSYFWFEMEK